jgi:hypothetical protein
VIVFSWQLLFGQLPTKGNLFQTWDFLQHPTIGLYMVSIDHGIGRPFIWNVPFCLWIVVQSFKVA